MQHACGTCQRCVWCVCFSWDYLYDEVGFNQISVHMPGLNINTWIQQQQPIEGLRIEGPRTLPVSR